MRASNFAFRTGCCKIKRCEESKTTLKNLFASHLAEFNTTLKLLRITDQWYIVPIKFRFGRNKDFLVLLLLPLAGVPKDGKHFDADWRLISSASFHTSPDNCEGVCRNETATIKTVRKKPFRRWCDWRDLVELSFLKQNVLQRLGKFLNDPLYGDKMKQIGATCLEKIVQWNHNIIFE